MWQSSRNMTQLSLRRIRGWLDSSCNLPLDVPFTAAVARAAGVPRSTAHALVPARTAAAAHSPGVRRSPGAGLPDLRAQCLSLVAPDDAVICDRHAGWLLGAEMVLAPNEHLDVLPVSMYLPTGRRLRNSLVREWRAPSADPRTSPRSSGFPVTTMLRTAWDLGRVRSRERAISGHRPDAPAARVSARRLPRRHRAVPRRTVGHHVADARSTGRWPCRVATGVHTPAVLDRCRTSAARSSARGLGRRCDDRQARHRAPRPSLRGRVRRSRVALLARPASSRPSTSCRRSAHEDFTVDVFKRKNVFGPHRDVEERLMAAAMRADRVGRVHF